MTEFKFPLLLSVRGKKIDKFDGLLPFNWEEITCQDVVGQGTDGAVLVVPYCKDSPF